MTLPTGVLYCGESHPEPYWGRRLGLDDVNEVFALHRRVIRVLSADLVAAETRDFFLDHVECKGRILGLFARQGLVAYAVLGLPGSEDANFGTDHRLSIDQMLRVAHLDGASVDPLYRGNHLHRLLVHWRLDEARSAGRPIVLSTTAPGNPYSLDNLLACGLQIRGLMRKFGGWRYLLRRDLDLDAVPAGTGRWVDAEDLTAHTDLLQAGWRGWMARDGERREILFTPVLEKPVKGWEFQCNEAPLGSQPISRQ